MKRLSKSRPRAAALSMALGLGILQASGSLQAFSVSVHADITKEELAQIQGRAGAGLVFQWDDLALNHIADANRAVDDIVDGSAALYSPDRHFTNEDVSAASERIIEFRRRIIQTARTKGAVQSGKRAGSQVIREDLGKVIHTIQDYYSHGNWVDLGNTDIDRRLGVSVIPRVPTSVAPCPSNPNSYAPNAGGALSTSYFIGFGLRETIGCDLQQLPANKCFHGNYRPTCMGVNKDLSAKDAASEGVAQNPLHGAARALAAKATREFVQGIVDELENDYDALRQVFNLRSSFVAVVDHTTSMSASIAGAKNLVGQMVTAVSQDAELAPENYILVSYGDPDVDPAIVTVDPQMFLSHINGISLHGGGTDCPELTNSGILTAANAASFGADIWVFTDATSKDREKLNALTALAKSKGLKINFALTGSCSPTDPGYIQLASDTGGQVMRVQPSQIGQLADAIIPAMGYGRGEVLNVSKVLANGSIDRHSLPVETGMREVTIALSVPPNDVPANHSVVLTDPSGAVVVSGPGVAIKHFNGNYTARITTPTPGVWSLAISGSGPYALTAGGIGAIQFPMFEFVDVNTDIHGGLFPRGGLPLVGEDALASASVFGPVTGVTFESIDLAGNTLYTIPMSQQTPMEDEDNYIGSVPVTGMPFRVRARGVDDQGRAFTRVHPAVWSASTVAVSRSEQIPVEGAAGHAVVVPYEVTNTGVTGRFQLSAAVDNGFGAQVEPTQIDIASGQTAQFLVTYAIPDESVFLETAEAVITATRANNQRDYNSASTQVSSNGVAIRSIAPGEIADGLTGAAGEAIAFRVPVPTGKTSISVISYGGTGNISLFGADGRPASRESYDVFSTRQGNAETIRFTGLAGSAVYFIVSGESAFSGVSVRVQ